MTQREYDALYNQLQAVTIQQQHCVTWLEQIQKTLSELKQKTLVVTSIDKDIDKLKVDVQALKDELEET